jgi:hypothetical protein
LGIFIWIMFFKKYTIKLYVYYNYSIYLLLLQIVFISTAACLIQQRNLYIWQPQKNIITCSDLNIFNWKILSEIYDFPFNIALTCIHTFLIVLFFFLFQILVIILYDLNIKKKKIQRCREIIYIILKELATVLCVTYIVVCYGSFLHF